MKTDKQKAIDNARRATSKWYVHTILSDGRQDTTSFEHLHEANDFYNQLPAAEGVDKVADITRDPKHPGTGREISRLKWN